jgi:AcrR family transcriptional regulator
MFETVVQDAKDTKTRILDVAERLMGEQGLGVPLRSITAEAGVNLAAVNYHFQSKDALLDAVIARRMKPVNERRLALLDALETAHPGGRLPLEGVLRAFLSPVFEIAGTITHLQPLIGQIYSHPKEFLRRVHARHLTVIIQRFGAALHRAMPELSQTEVAWRMQFLVGTMVHLLNWSPFLDQLTGGLCDASDTNAMLERVVAYAVAGFQCPPTKKRNEANE